MPASAAATGKQLSFQVNPIILTGGVAANIPAGVLPLAQLFYGTSPTGLGLPYNPNKLDDAFGAFNVLPGGTLIAQAVAKYPFANQHVAANAVIAEPLTLSVIMDAPMRGPQPFDVKSAIFSALKATLDAHNNVGGLYTVYTPAFMYQNLVLLSLTDNSRGNNSLPQNAWRFDFEKPLVAQEDVELALNQLMSKVSNGTPTQPNQSGPLPGSSTGQAQYLQSPNAGLGANIFTGSPYTLNSGNWSNYPPIASQGGSPFNGIS
jgi:hypothetical protein